MEPNRPTATYLGPEGVLAKKRQYLVPCSYHFYARPPQLVRGSMQYLWDSEGTRYLDFFAGVSVMACGHANPTILAATVAQMGQLQHTTSVYLTQPVVDLAERLAGWLPGGLTRTFFCNSGSEANEGAFLAARLHTGRHRILSLDRGLHGRTYLGMSATGLGMWRTDPHLDPAFTVLPGPLDADRSLAALEAELAAGDVAALIVEPIQGNGGIVPLPDAYLRALKARLEAHGALLIADEIQTGFGRTGTRFAIEASGVVPDLLTMAKALGNGVPIAAYAATEAVAASFTKPSASTLGGNPVSCATALAVLDYLDENELVDRAAALGQRLGDGLKALAARNPRVADVRGRGLMWGLELVDDAGNPDPGATDRVLEFTKDHGLLVGKNGPHRNVVALQPPLVIDEANVDFAVEVLGRALAP
jgi:alanine-glyoxylate transaminase/(R)-3-amino-2-methylpropionate-pyruvate transaminase